MKMTIEKHNVKSAQKKIQEQATPVRGLRKEDEVKGEGMKNLKCNM